MKNKHLQKNLALRIGILVVIVAYIVYYYNKYLQDKSPGWTILFALFLIFISALSISLYKRKPSLWFSLAGLSFSVYWTALFFILGVLLILSGGVLSIVYLFSNPTRLPLTLIFTLLGCGSVYFGIRIHKFGKKIGKTKIKGKK